MTLYCFPYVNAFGNVTSNTNGIIEVIYHINEALGSHSKYLIYVAGFFLFLMSAECFSSHPRICTLFVGSKSIIIFEHVALCMFWVYKVVLSKQEKSKRAYNGILY
uniref:Uncharacterized protein n=1 Tax=Cacopsylla melanoneura TaxID=428564 RepID=A0A8D9FES1_9HEMI